MAPGWAGQPQWRVLALGFDSARQFLTAWRAWKDDPRRPRMLHFVAIHTGAPAFDQAPARLQPLAQELGHQCDGLLPGVHRLVFEDGHVLLTLCLGDVDKMLRQQEFHADAVLLASQEVNLKALARCCRRGTAVTATDESGALAAALERHGFTVDRHGNKPLRHAIFAPAWEPRGRAPQSPTVPGDCIVIGAGLAGAAAAASMARRGWKVTVLDAAPLPASGATAGCRRARCGARAGLPATRTRLTRDGARATLQQAQALLEAGRDWEPSGVFEHHVDGVQPRAAPLGQAAAVWTRPADAQQKRAAGLASHAAADWHEKAAWIRPASLVQAWLAQPGVQVTCGAQVCALVRDGRTWLAQDADGAVLARGDLVIVAAAFASGALVQGLKLQPVRGQVSWALHQTKLQLPPFPINGDGAFIPSVPTPEGPAWLCGSSFDRANADLAPRAADQRENHDRLRHILPSVAAQLENAFAEENVRAWTGIRCASTDRRPLVGPLDEEASDGPWLSTAMGSRGLTFAALAAELIAARIHGEPLPLARNLARSLAPARQHRH